MEVWNGVGTNAHRTDDEIRGFLGGNLLRLYEANWGS
jgi:hypothetical protein